MTNEAKHLVSPDVLVNIGVDEDFKVIRVIVYSGDTGYHLGRNESILLVNTSELLSRCPDIDAYADGLAEEAERLRIAKYSVTMPQSQELKSEGADDPEL